MAEKISEGTPKDVQEFLLGVDGGPWFVSKRGDTFYSSDPSKAIGGIWREVFLETTKGVNRELGWIVGALAEALYWKEEEPCTFCEVFTSHFQARAGDLLASFAVRIDTDGTAEYGVDVTIAPYQGEDVPTAEALLTQTPPDGDCPECSKPYWKMSNLPGGLERLCLGCVQKIQAEARRIEDWGDESLYPLEGWYYSPDTNYYMKF